MNDTASLEIRVLSDQVDAANRRLDNLEKKGARAERATDGLTGAFTRLAGPLLAAVSATAALSKLVDVSREFDKLNAGLITATGSAEGAQAGAHGPRIAPYPIKLGKNDNIVYRLGRTTSVCVYCK